MRGKVVLTRFKLCVILLVEKGKTLNLLCCVGMCATAIAMPLPCHAIAMPHSTGESLVQCITMVKWIVFHFLLPSIFFISPRFGLGFGCGRLFLFLKPRHRLSTIVWGENENKLTTATTKQHIRKWKRRRKVHANNAFVVCWYTGTLVWKLQAVKRVSMVK